MAFDTQFSRVSIPEGTLSTLFVLLMLSIGWTIYLTVETQANGFQAAVFGSHFIYRPQWFIDLCQFGGPVATGLCAVWVIGHVTAWTLVSGLIVYYAVQLYDGIREGTVKLRSRFPYLALNASPRAERKINTGVTPTGRDLVRIPKNNVRVVIQTAENVTFNNVFPEYYMRMARRELTLKREPTTPVEKLEIAVMGMLAAHADWPADPSGHHAKTTLLKHSIAIRDDLRRRLSDEPLAGVIGLAHDIGKLIAYKPDRSPQGDVTWIKKTQQVDRLSAQVMRLTPEFWALTYEDRTTLNLVLTYTHSPELMPRGLNNGRYRELLNAVREADGVNTRNEQRAAVHAADRQDIIEAIRGKLVDILSILNINQSRQADANADGWSQPGNGILLVAASRLRENLKGRFPAEFEQALALAANDVPGRRHPALYAIHRALEEEGLLVPRWKGFAPELGLFDARIGQYTFSGLFLLDLPEVRRREPELTAAWSKCQYKIRIKTENAKRRINEKSGTSATR